MKMRLKTTVYNLEIRINAHSRNLNKKCFGVCWRKWTHSNFLSVKTTLFQLAISHILTVILTAFVMESLRHL